MRNDLWILLNRANNGVGVAVIATRDNPYGPLTVWFEHKRYKDPVKTAGEYKVSRLIKDCIVDYEGVVLVLENFDGDVVTGEAPPTRYD